MDSSVLCLCVIFHLITESSNDSNGWVNKSFYYMFVQITSDYKKFHALMFTHISTVPEDPPCTAKCLKSLEAMKECIVFEK